MTNPPPKPNHDRHVGQDIPPPAFVSLGMVVLDELQFPHLPTLFDVCGGSGAYATLGARLTVPVDEANTVACIVLSGDDFPESVLDTLRSWHVRLERQTYPGQKSTRGLLKYEDDTFGRKSFRYLTTPLSPRVRHIKDSSLLHSQTFHILARPDDLLVHISELSLHRVQSHNDGRPMVIWEPLPSDCKPVHLDAHLQALQQVDVFSPNHLELMSLFEGAEDLSRPFDRLLIENYAKRCLDAKAPGSANAGFGVIVRAGEHGCLIQSALQGCRWLPAYYGEHSTRVVDPTGAGNTFLGAFGNMFAKTGDLHEAAIFGTVAASFALEQFGLPNFDVVDGRDTWNGDTFGERLGRYRP